MQEKINNLGELELEVLKIIWDIQPCTVQKVAEILADRNGYARTTILTIIQRLTQKGFLTRSKVDGIWHYQACQKKNNVMSSLLSQFIDKVFDGSCSGLLQHLAPEKLSKKELSELENLLNKARKGEKK